MVTFAQAQERAERWVNGGLPAYQHREVRIREFELGFVAWAEDRPDGPTSDGGRVRLVVARDSGESTLWPGLPVGEVIRRFEEAYGAAPVVDAPAPAPQRVDLEATSFLLTPPEWLQEAADRMGLPGRPEASGGGTAGASGAGSAPGGGSSSGGAPGASPGGWPTPAAGAPAASAGGTSGSGGGSWADTSGSGSGESIELPHTVFAPPLSGSDDEDRPASSGGGGEVPTALMPDGSSLPRTQFSPALGDPAEGEPSGRPAGPSDGAAPGAADIADAATSRAPREGRPGRGGGPSVPPPPGAPGTPGAPGARPPEAESAGGYVPTQLVSSQELAAQAGADPSSGPGASSGPGPEGGTPPSGGVHQAATMLSGPAAGSGGRPAAPSPPGAPGVPGAPGGPPPAPGAPGTPPPGAPGTPPPGGGVHQAATMLSGPGGPQHPAAPHAPQPPGPVGPGGPGAYGYPQQSGLPTVGPGYMAVLRYRAPDGSEQQLIRRSAPGTPHPEWQIMYELRAMNVPPQQVLELHTELECCDLPAGYCARMIRETWPQVRISHTAAYGRDHASRQQGMRHLLEHQGELHQVADGPARPAPVRAPLQQVPPAAPVPPDAVGHELAQAFGPQAVFRFDQRAVSRQGVPEVVAQTLVRAGLPVDFGPFFWAQAQPGRPVPTLAELAQERGVHPAPDAGTYLVMGSDFGRQLCVQYGTAHIVAVPLEAGPGGTPAAPQFVNTGLPEFARCLGLLGRMWRLRFGLTPEQAGRWTVDFQNQLLSLDAAALSDPENWWSVLLEQMWDGLL